MRTKSIGISSQINSHASYSSDTISYFYYWHFLVLGTKFQKCLTPNTHFTLKTDSEFIVVSLVAINQGHCDSTVHCQRISFMYIRRTCDEVSVYEQSFKLPINDAEAMWCETEIVNHVVRVHFQVRS